MLAPAFVESTAPVPSGALPSVAYAPGWAPAVLTDRGAAACRLSDFQDAWDQLTSADRRWFAEWLTELLVDACQEAAA